MLLACGINHKTASIAAREKLVFYPETIVASLRELVECEKIPEVAILSTCNRTEIYCGNYDNNHILKNWLSRRYQINDHSLYFYRDQAAVQHMMRVASGLDSMVLGEPQIFGQMKTAYQIAGQAGTVGTRLHRLFQYVFAVTKQVRTDTAISASPVSIAFTAVKLTHRIFSNLANAHVLLIGAGETIELTARHLVEQGVKHITVANRTVAKAKNIANIFHGTAIALGAIPEYIANADIVISSTASQLPILGKGCIERALKLRKRRPMLLIDLAVPRDIEPEVATLEDIYLYSIDDLQSIANQGAQSRAQAAQKAEEMIQHKSQHFMHWLRSLEAVQAIRNYREQSEQWRDAELHRAKQRLANGTPVEIVLEQLAYHLTNKIMHAPSIALREISITENMTTEDINV